MTSASGRKRRRYGAQFKAMVLAQCDEPGASVAQVAMSHGINDNVVHRWRQLARQELGQPVGAPAAPAASELSTHFIPLPLPAPGSSAVKTEVRLEIKRASTTVNIAWPDQSLADLAAFVRELLK